MRDEMGRALAAAILALVTTGGVAAAQSRPDLTGLWISPTADISVVLLPGEEIALTSYGAERYRKLDMANSPSYKCLPYGPTRGLQSTNPFQIIQTPDLVAIITEHIDYRMIYTDGRGHPDDILDYPEWMGHSIGRWEGDTLVVENKGFNENSWLDYFGHPHTDQMHVVERWTRPNKQTLHYEATVNDPGAYTRPFTFAWDIPWREGAELPEYICQENNRYLNRLEDDLGQPIFGPRPQPGRKPAGGSR